MRYHILLTVPDDFRGWLVTDILIRDIDNKLGKALKIRAIQHGRTREAEIKFILKSVVSRRPEKRSLAEVLMDIPKLDINTDDLFERPANSARNLE